MIGTINADQMARYQDALNKKIYGVKGAITRTTAVPKTSGAPKKETLAERMRRQNKNK